MLQTTYTKTTIAAPEAQCRDEPTTTPMDWRDWLDVAQEEAQDAQRACHSDLHRQQELRMISISRAIAALLYAQDLVGNEGVHYAGK